MFRTFLEITRERGGGGNKLMGYEIFFSFEQKFFDKKTSSTKEGGGETKSENEEAVVGLKNGFLVFPRTYTKILKRYRVVSFYWFLW